VITMPDLHPDDLAARIELTNTLKDLRRLQGLGLRPYAAILGTSFSRVHTIETDPTPNPSLLSLERRADALGHYLIVNMVGLPVIDDPITAILAAARQPTTPDDRAETTAAVLGARLNHARVGLGISVDTLAERLGISASAITKQHVAGPEARLATWQRYARGLGGSLNVQLAQLQIAQVAA
jgi:transcriptional regulator with XRE-family HTH domain